MDELTHLLLRAGEGDETALSDFVTLAQADVWRFCAALLIRSEADDATQETLIRAWRSAPGFRGDSSARTWLFTIARRVCVGYIDRRVRPGAAVPAGLSPAPVPASSADHGEAVVLDSLVRDLDLDRRSAFVLTQMLGLSYEQAALVCTCPVGTIRSRVARARSDLHDAIADSAADPQSRSRRGGRRERRR